MEYIVLDLEGNIKMTQTFSLASRSSPSSAEHKAMTITDSASDLKQQVGYKGDEAQKAKISTMD